MVGDLQSQVIFLPSSGADRRTTGSFGKGSFEGASPSSLSGSYDLPGYSLGIREELSYLNERI